MAQQSLKEAKEQVQYENRVEWLKAEHDRLQKAVDTLNVEIGKKSADYQQFISLKDSESKKIRAEGIAILEQAKKSKAAVDEEANNLKSSKDAHDLEKQQLEREKRILAGQKEQIQHFIQALRRDLAVLDLEVK